MLLNTDIGIIFAACSVGGARSDGDPRELIVAAAGQGAVLVNSEEITGTHLSNDIINWPLSL